MIFSGYLAEIINVIANIGSRGLSLLLVLFGIAVIRNGTKIHHNILWLLTIIIILSPIIISFDSELIIDSFINFVLILILLILLSKQLYKQLFISKNLSSILFYGFFALTIISVFQYRSDIYLFGRPILFFSEPAHMVRELSVAMAIILANLTRNRFENLNIVLFLFVGIFCPSLLAVTFAFGFSFIKFINYLRNSSLRRRFLQSFYACLALIFLVPYLFQFSYFFERIVSISDYENSENFTALVLLQGYENAYLVLTNSFFGEGIGQAANSPKGLITQIIYDLSAGKSLNLEDAGSLFPKLVIELGWPGLFLSIGLIVISIKKIFINPKTTQEKLLQFISMVFLICFVFRSSGYFTTINVVFLLSFIYIPKYTNVNSRRL